MPTVFVSTDWFHIPNALCLLRRLVFRGFRMQILSVKFTIKTWYHKWYFIKCMQLQWKLLQWTEQQSNDLQQMPSFLHSTTRFHFRRRLPVRSRILFVKINMPLLRRRQIPQQHLHQPKHLVVRNMPTRGGLQRQRWSTQPWTFFWMVKMPQQ